MPCISITAAIIAYISRNLNAAQVTNSLLPSMSWLEFHNLSGIIIAIISITINLNNHNNIKKKIHLDLPVLQMVLHHRGKAHHGPSEVKLSSAESKVSTNFRRNFYSHNTRVFLGGLVDQNFMDLYEFQIPPAQYHEMGIRISFLNLETACSVVKRGAWGRPVEGKAFAFCVF